MQDSPASASLLAPVPVPVPAPTPAPTPAPGESIAALRDRFARDGYVVLPDLVPSDQVAVLIDALRRIETEQGFGYAQTAFEGYQTVRINNLLAHDDVFAQVVLEPTVLALAEAILDKELLLSSLCSLTLGPGQPAQPLHEDTQQIPLPRPHPTLAVNAMWALSDFTEANGATRIVPGSHRFDHPPPYGGDVPTVSATMRAGSVMLFDSALWHHGGANTTDERRYAVSCYYGAGWMRQQENLQLGIPRETAARLPRRLQELLGYGIYRGQYGHIDNRDPITLLGQPGRKTVWQASDDKRGRETSKAAGAIRSPSNGS